MLLDVSKRRDFETCFSNSVHFHIFTHPSAFCSTLYSPEAVPVGSAHISYNANLLHSGFIFPTIFFLKNSGFISPTFSINSQIQASIYPTIWVRKKTQVLYFLQLRSNSLLPLRGHCPPFRRGEGASSGPNLVSSSQTL